MNEHICILILEDSPLDLFLVRIALSKVPPANFDFLETDRLSGALAMLGEKLVDLVLTDLNLPDSLGCETVRALLRASKGVPVWVLTGDNDPQMATQLLHEGTCGCLSKDDLNTPALQQAIDAAIQHKHAIH